jgi:hypothetical protein
MNNQGSVQCTEGLISFQSNRVLHSLTNDIVILKHHQGPATAMFAATPGYCRLPTVFLNFQVFIQKLPRALLAKCLSVTNECTNDQLHLLSPYWRTNTRNYPVMFVGVTQRNLSGELHSGCMNKCDIFKICCF